MTDVAKAIKLDQFEQKFFLQLNEFRQVNRYCNVRFDVNGKIFPCHRVVLGTASPYFDTMFNGVFKESSSDIISMKEIETEAFEEILNAIYTASIRLLPSNVYFILKASHLLLLKEIENACVSYIMENCNSIHYLVDTCLFAENIQQKTLNSKCIRTISTDLINYSKTDSFIQIPIDTFKSILSMWIPMKDEEESAVLLILKWSKENEASRETVHDLLKSSNLEIIKLINPTLMAKFMITSDDTSMKITTQNNVPAELMDSDSYFDLNLYLEAVDVKTGQKGWAVLKIDDKLDNYVLSSFYPTSSSYKKVCRVGSKMYCFEYFTTNQQNGFICYDENDSKTVLPTPKEVFQSYKLASMETSIYLMALKEKRLIVWIYDCELKNWRNSLKKTDHKKCYDDVLDYTFLNGVFHVITMNRAEEYDHVLFSIDCHSLLVQKITTVMLDTVFMFCSFDNKIALWNSYRNEYYIEFFDLITNQWMPDVFSMNIYRESFHVIHHNGVVYIVVNNRDVKNEKYTFETNEWTELPALPKRVTFHDKNGSKVLATGTVFGSDSKAT